MASTHTIIETPVGKLTLVARDGSLSGLYFPAHWTRPDPTGFGPRSGSGFEAVVQQVAEYFAGERAAFDLPTAVAGNGLQRKVWQRLNQIPYGETTTYGEIAGELGDPSMARAVGGAVGQNPLSIIVPCHRVIGRDGSLTGFAGGLERKRFLLELEGALAPMPEPAPSLF